MNMNILKISKAFFLILAVVLFANSSVLLSQNTIKEIDVDGFKVIIKNTGKDVISARLFVTGGTANYPLDKQGIEAVAYSYIIKGGTTNHE
jgi:hypothetical protein